MPLLPFLLRIVFYIFDCTPDIDFRIEKHHPAPMGPWRRNRAARSSTLLERMEVPLSQPRGRGTLQQVCDLEEIVPVPTDHQVNVIPHDRTGMDRVVCPLRLVRERETYLAGLHTAELNRWVRE
nr:hypothetical protein [Humisphaera borealis]